MATPKDVTINDIIQGRLYIDPVQGGNLTVQRDYTYVGDTQADQDLLNLLGGQAWARVVVWAGIPQNIQDALILIDQWTESGILEDEGMT